MTNTNILLDKFKEACSLDSDYAAATSLGLTRATISGWRHGKSHANAEAVAAMCEAIDEPLRTWLPLIEAERARTPADRKVWLRLASAAAAFALTLSLGRPDVQTNTLAALYSLAHNLGQMYIMSSIRGCGRRLARIMRAWSNSYGLRQCPATMTA